VAAGVVAADVELDELQAGTTRIKTRIRMSKPDHFFTEFLLLKIMLLIFSEF